MATAVGQVTSVASKGVVNTNTIEGLALLGSGADRVAVAYTACFGVGEHTSVTLDGQPMTFAGRISVSGTHELQRWIMLEADLPAGGVEYDLVVTPSVANMGNLYLVTYTGVDQTIPMSDILQDNDKSLVFPGTGTSGNLICDVGCGVDGFDFAVSAQTGDQAAQHINAAGGDDTDDSTLLYLGSGPSAVDFDASITYAQPNMAYGAFEVYAVGQAPPATAVLGGSVVPSMTEGDATAGGETILWESNQL